MQGEVCSHWNTFVAQSLMNRPIYKDECSKCFITPKHDHGLNICLSCLQGWCVNPANNHMDLHVKSTHKSEMDQHPIFMNVKMTEKLL
jgi:ubiquitin carboxyl-terminal hydrolase 5/13